jgi:predicted nucleic acid-binding protein
MPDVLVDTDLFIEHLRGATELKPGKHRLHYSVITRAELLAGSSAAAHISQLLGPFRELPSTVRSPSAPVASRMSAGCACPTR